MRFQAPVLALLGLVPLFVACGDGAIRGAPAEVVSTVRVLVDRSRATPPNGTFGGASERALETRLWLSSRPDSDRAACGGERCALLVLAHGFGGNTARFDAIGRGLAEAGYVVAAARFPLTNEAAPGGHLTGIGDTLQQPADLSFVIDELLRASRDAGDARLGGRIDPDRIGVVGHSLGGVTAIAHSRVACCADSRVDAVALVAPVAPLAEGLFGEPVDARGPPTLVVSGSVDPVVPPEGPAALYDEIDPPRVHLLLAGASHSDLIENTGPPGPYVDVTRRAMVAFFDQMLGGAGDLVAVAEEIRAEGNAVRYDLGG